MYILVPCNCVWVFAQLKNLQVPFYSPKTERIKYLNKNNVVQYARGLTWARYGWPVTPELTAMLGRKTIGCDHETDALSGFLTLALTPAIDNISHTEAFLATAP